MGLTDNWQMAKILTDNWHLYPPARPSDCVVNEKCCSVDGGQGICPLFSSPPRGIWQLKSPHPREFAIQGKKNADAWGSARGGGGRLGAAGIDWCIKALWTKQFYIGVWAETTFFYPA